MVTDSARPDGSRVWTSYPELWGQHLCLDLINSRETDSRGSGRIIDWLPRPGWRAGLLSTWGLTLDDPDEPVPMAALMELRSFLRPVLEAWSAGGRPSEHDAQRLRTMVALAPVTREVTEEPDGYRVEIRPFTRNWNWVLAEVAVSAIELMAEGTPARLRKCRNADCSWLFYDDTLNHSRRWCSSRACGNLLKVRRFRAARR